MYLDEHLYKELNLLAKAEDSSMAKVARAILKEGVERKKQQDYSGKKVLQRLLTIKATGGPSDLSLHIDHYLYGTKKHHA